MHLLDPSWEIDPFDVQVALKFHQNHTARYFSLGFHSSYKSGTTFSAPLPAAFINLPLLPIT